MPNWASAHRNELPLIQWTARPSSRRRSGPAQGLCSRTTARRRYVDAIKYAQRTHHPLLVSYMKASLGHFAVEAGNPRPGLTMIEHASALLDDSAPDAARAWLESLRAIAY